MDCTSYYGSGAFSAKQLRIPFWIKWRKEMEDKKKYQKGKVSNLAEFVAE